MTAADLATELSDREIPFDVLLDAGMLLLETDPNSVAAVMDWLGKRGLLGAFEGFVPTGVYGG